MDPSSSTELFAQGVEWAGMAVRICSLTKLSVSCVFFILIFFKKKEAPLPLHEHNELKELTVENILLIKGSEAEGKSPRALSLAEKTGVLVIAVRREDKLLLHRLAETILVAGDTVYCIGQKADLEIVSEWFDQRLVNDNT